MELDYLDAFTAKFLAIETSKCILKIDLETSLLKKVKMPLLLNLKWPHHW